MTTPDPSQTPSLTRRLLAENAREYWRGYLLGFVLLTIASAMTAASAWVMEDVINEVFVDPVPGLVFTVSATVAAIFFVRGVTTYAAQVVLARIGNRIVASLQTRMFAQVQAQSLAWIDKQEMGDLMVRFQQGVLSARTALQLLIMAAGRDILSLIALVVVMFLQDPLMSFFALFVAPPVVLGIMAVMKRMTRVAQSEFESVSHLTGLVKESYLGARIVRSFNLQDSLQDRADESVRTVRRLNDKIARLSNITSPVMDMLGGFVFAAVILYGGYRISNGTLDAGSLFSFLTAFLLAYEPGKRLGKFNVDYRRQMVGVAMLYEVLDQIPDESERGNGALPLGEGAITFDSVSFSYGETRVLDTLTLEMPAQRVTALVGPSGGGKSTVLAMIDRLYRPDEGTVRIDGADISTVSASELRSEIAVVGQDAFLFDLTVSENIAMGRAGATQAEIEQAARDANAHDFIMALPGGYDARVGEGGGRLSGGQRQRIAIARAMLSDAPILLLDEATSALDTASEQKVMEAIDRLMQGRTVVVIAHRLSTIRNADLIHVIESGQRRESGTHEELLSRDGLYRQLHDIQSGD
ncbi:ABC transporter ATP-binding protein [Pontivivens insulae]|uniref:Lipid A export ATP-binding/permease protein MsbA n=1 Tax=Pontivivens insulae TaxID=1639689 RepID=A0A2R8AAD2_9RHOB|nr:ABC transporter ATP-binding protein [Pontivivens insulae]RED12955.1 ATP-binding cassette subfamily B protein [Pontivivens insulae]SPF29048.1 Lipid A export ATP-binding/permease protein MsbA [Pontivivens insulae]